MLNLRNFVPADLAKINLRVNLPLYSSDYFEVFSLLTDHCTVYIFIGVLHTPYETVHDGRRLLIVQSIYLLFYRPPMRQYMMDGDFFVGAALATTLTKLALKFINNTNDMKRQNVSVWGVELIVNQWHEATECKCIAVYLIQMLLIDLSDWKVDIKHVQLNISNPDVS